MRWKLRRQVKKNEPGMKKSSEETVSSRKLLSMKSNIEVFGWNTKSYEHWGLVGGYEETHTPGNISADERRIKYTLKDKNK